jgi:hypothetical protein
MVNTPDELNANTLAQTGDRLPDDPAEIRAQIRRTRAEMGQTLDQIQSQLSPEFIRQQTEDALREATMEKVEKMAQRAEYKMNTWRSNAIDTIKDNPLPAAMAGLGLGWLLMSGRNNRDAAERQRYGDRYRTRYYGEDVDTYDEGVSGGRYRYPLNSNYETYERNPYGSPARDERYERHPYGEDARPGTVTRGTGASSTMDDVRSSAENTAARAEQKAKQTAADVKDSAADAVDSLQDTMQGASRSVQEFAGETAAQARRRADWAERELQREMRMAKSSFRQTLDENPLALGIAALAAGALVGLAIPGTQRENEWMGETRDRLVEDVTATAQETVRKATNVIEETAQTAVSEGKKQAKKEDLLPSS